MITERISSAGVTARTRALRAVTRAMSSGTLAHGRLGLLDATVAKGAVHVLGGLAVRRRLSAAHFPYWERYAYGMLTGEHELMVQEALRRTVAPGMTVFDVGADIGFFSIVGSALTGPTGRVEAFEPVPRSVKAVRANAALNGLHNVSVHSVAVGERSGRETLLVQAQDSWSYLADRGPQDDSRERVAVDLVCLDDEIAAGRLPEPDVVKIDVEGSEGSVLRGLRKTLSTRSVAVICELHETNAEVVELLSELGYESENLDGPEPVIDAGPVHLLARPR